MTHAQSRTARAILVLCSLFCAPLCGAIESRPASVPQPERINDPYVAPSSLGPVIRSTPVVVVQGPFVSRQVNVDSNGMNIVGDAANEPSMAVDPTNPNRIAIGWRQFDTIDSDFRQAGLNNSLDGGRSWPGYRVLDPGVFRTDPVLDFDLNGQFYYQSLYNHELHNVDVFRSPDGGITWLESVECYGGDKNWMVVDRSNSGGSGHVYCMWRQPGACCGENIFSRSTDGGASYMPPVPVPHSPAWGSMSVGPDGELYVAGVRETDHSAFWVEKSTTARDPDASPTFDQGQNIEMGGTLMFWQGGPNPDGLLGQTWVATDHSSGDTRGYVYVLCSVDPPGPDPLNLHIVRSADGGNTWTPPIRINDDPTWLTAWQWFGTLSVAPNGRLDVVWNDTRNTGQVNLAELYYAYSMDAGDTWSTNTPASPVFDSFAGWPSQNKMGDYYNLISDEAGANLAWAATFNGEQDVYFLRLGDCNENGVHDGTDLVEGTSQDCNDNAIPDECDALTGGDYEADGDVGRADFQALAACLAGANTPPSPPEAACAATCLSAFDADGDDDVDLYDFGVFTTNYTGHR